MERKLAEYRAKKERETRINNLKLQIKRLFTQSKEKEADVSESEATQQEPLLPPAEQESSELLDEPVESNDDETISCSYSLTDLFYYLLWFLLWCVLYKIFIEWQFGTVFFITSAIIFMYINTRTGPKGKNEVSAYSVFNKDCKSIDGTLKAEQFEREIRYGAGSVH